MGAHSKFSGRKSLLVFFLFVCFSQASFKIRCNTDMHEKQSSIICFHLNPSVTHAINSKAPAFVSEVTPTISTAYSSFTGASFPKQIYYTLPEEGLHETGENSDLQKYNRQ